MKKVKLLMVGDGVSKTGFSTVLTNLIQNLPKSLYTVDHLAINYRGDPHPYNWNIYPAMLGGDYMGYNRIKEFSTREYDGIFILNDLWVIKDYLTLIKKYFKKVPPIIIYTPVDSMNLDLEWFADYDIVTKLVLYTEFGRNEVLQVKEGLNLSVIPHGVDNKLFYKLSEPKSEIKKRVYQKEESGEYFIFLNANRNQPRKRIDLTMKGFTIFSQNKPKNVKLHLHMGLKDAGLDILKFGFRLGIDERLIITSMNQNIQQIPEKRLNDTYNACEVGINTALGEGWSLTNHEHAVTGAPQIVSDNSALHELYKDCGLLVPTMSITNLDNLTEAGLVTPLGVAEQMEKIYSDKELYEELSKKTLDKFAREEYTWKYIVENRWLPLFSEIY
jgi:glycosyltransferase involved in cell wall biosynthesis